MAVGAGGVSEAASVGDEVAINALLADSEDGVVASAGGTIFGNGGSAALEVLVVVSERGVVGALEVVRLPSESDVSRLDDANINWNSEEIVSWLNEPIGCVGSYASGKDWIGSCGVGSDLLVGEDGEEVASSGVGPIIGCCGGSDGIEFRGEGVSFKEGDGEEGEAYFGL